MLPLPLVLLLQVRRHKVLSEGGRIWFFMIELLVGHGKGGLLVVHGGKQILVYVYIYIHVDVLGGNRPHLVLLAHHWLGTARPLIFFALLLKQRLQAGVGTRDCLFGEHSLHSVELWSC